MKKKGRGRKEREVGRNRQDSQRKKSNKRWSINAATEQQTPEANNATLVTLMLTTNDMFEVFAEKKFIV